MTEERVLKGVGVAPGIVIGRKYGGMGWSQTLYNGTVEMVSRGDASFMTIYAMGSCGELLERFASEEIKDRYLPRIVQGTTAVLEHALAAEILRGLRRGWGGETEKEKRQQQSESHGRLLRR